MSGRREQGGLWPLRVCARCLGPVRRWEAGAWCLGRGSPSGPLSCVPSLGLLWPLGMHVSQREHGMGHSDTCSSNLPSLPSLRPPAGAGARTPGWPCSGQQAEALPLHPGLQASRLLPLCSLHSAPCPCPSAVRTSCRKPLWEGWCPWEGSRVGAGLPEAGSDHTEPPVQTG